MNNNDIKLNNMHLGTNSLDRYNLRSNNKDKVLRFARYYYGNAPTIISNY